MKEFSAYDCALDGINLIEAGAGTGKTYNIQTLTARIVLEQAIPITQVLVVTYTRAATAELQERLRKVLDSLLRMLNAATVPDGEEERCRKILDNLRQLAENAPFWKLHIEGSKPQNQEETFLRNARFLLRNALRDFDQAAISTIHSFCQRMLTENAFESGLRYGMELVSDTSELTDTLIQQFIRQEFYTCSEEETAVWESLEIVWQKTESEAPAGQGFRRRGNTFMEQLQSAMRDNDIDYYWGEAEQPGKLFIPAAREQLLMEIAACRQELADEWANLESVLKTLSQHLKPTFEDSWRQNHAALHDGKGAVNLGFLQQLTFAGLREQTYRRKTGNKLSINDDELQSCLDNPVFPLFKRLTRLLQDYRSRVYYDGLEFVKRELANQKNRDGFMTFNDLLNELELRLRDPQRGPLLKQVIRKQFPFALVDEFQDTDGVQFNIFHSIFAAAEPQESSGFFLIGDPKQSIYRFRGGDIFTYLRARKQVPEQRRFTLTTNYRSSRSFIEEINNFYRFNQPYPFAHPELEIPLVAYPEIAKPALLHRGKEFSQPLSFVTAAGRKDQYYLGVAAEIESMHQSGHWSIGIENGASQPLKYSDFAILFRNNSHAREMEAILRQKGVPAVRIGTSNVLASESAQSMQIFLEAMLDPADSRALMQLLASPLHRKSAVELHALRSNGRLLHFQAWISELGATWKSKSFLPMIMQYLGDGEQEVMLQLLAGEDGERELMDFLHLAEILSKAETEKRLSHEALYQHFMAQRQQMRDDDDNLVRLASARDAVVLATVHYSKGLEYPLVFLPDIHEKDGQSEAVCHYDCQGVARMLKDLTGLGMHKEKCALEAMQERLRLFYVAITRAKYFCKAWVESGGNSVFNYLFRQRGQEAFPEPVEDALAQIVSTGKTIMSEAELQQAGVQITAANKIEAIEEAAKTGDQEQESVAPVTAQPILQQLSHPERIRPFWRTLSATALMQSLLDGGAANKPGPEEAAAAESPVKDLDEADAIDEDGATLGEEKSAPVLSPEEWAALPPIFTFNPGKQTGSCWHAIFEKIDFAAGEQEIRQVCAEQLNLYSLSSDPAALATVSDMVGKVLRAELAPPPGCGEPFRLCEISGGERLSELDFTYGLKQGKKLSLDQDFLHRHGLPAQQAFEKTIARAMIGSIDLVARKNQRYYIIDWKSNVINYDLGSFSGSGLLGEMRRHAYPLQYLVYTCTLVEFLRQRMGRFGAQEYQQYFGGVFYLFLRGIDPQYPSRGIVKARPEYEDIEKMLEMMAI